MIAPFQNVVTGREPEAERNVDVVTAQKLESRRQHADHFKPISIQTDCFADDAWIAAEFLRPQTVADERRRRRAGAIILLGEEPPELRLYAEHWKEIPAHPPSRRRDRWINSCQVESGVEKTGHILERLRARAPIFVIRIGHCGADQRLFSPSPPERPDDPIREKLRA